MTTDLEFFLAVLLITENVAIVFIGCLGSTRRTDNDVFAEQLETSMRRRRHP